MLLNTANLELGDDVAAALDLEVGIGEHTLGIALVQDGKAPFGEVFRDAGGEIGGDNAATPLGFSIAQAGDLVAEAGKALLHRRQTLVLVGDRALGIDLILLQLLDLGDQAFDVASVVNLFLHLGHLARDLLEVALHHHQRGFLFLGIRGELDHFFLGGIALLLQGGILLFLGLDRGLTLGLALLGRLQVGLGRLQTGPFISGTLPVVIGKVAGCTEADR